MSKSEKLYKDSPKLERGEDGEMGVKKPSEADKENMGASGNPLPGSSGEMPIEMVHQGQRREMHHRHATEHLAMHHRQETEHAAHKGGDKKKLHGHHEKEMMELHTKHHEEMVSLHKKHMDLSSKEMVHKEEPEKKE